MTGSHIISNQDAQQCVKDVEKFTDKKNVLLKQYSTTVVPTGVAAIRGVQQMNLTVITTCLILWECSDEDWRSFQFNLKHGGIKSNGITA